MSIRDRFTFLQETREEHLGNELGVFLSVLVTAVLAAESSRLLQHRPSLRRHDFDSLLAARVITSYWLTRDRYLASARDCTRN